MLFTKEELEVMVMIMRRRKETYEKILMNGNPRNREQMEGWVDCCETVLEKLQKIHTWQQKKEGA